MCENDCKYRHQIGIKHEVSVNGTPAGFAARYPNDNQAICDIALLLFDGGPICTHLNGSMETCSLPTTYPEVVEVLESGKYNITVVTTS